MKHSGKLEKLGNILKRISDFAKHIYDFQIITYYVTFLKILFFLFQINYFSRKYFSNFQIITYYVNLFKVLFIINIV